MRPVIRLGNGDDDASVQAIYAPIVRETAISFELEIPDVKTFAAHGPGFQALGIIALVTALLTAYYSFRVWFRVCAGPVHYEPGEELISVRRGD